MAIPFTIPSQQQVSPERLRELYDFLQQLLIVCQQHHQAIISSSSSENIQSNRATGPPISCDSRMLSALSAALRANQRIRHHRLKRGDQNQPEAENASSTPEVESQNQRWKRVGTELRKIADEFESAAALEEVEGVDEVDAALPCCSRSSAPKQRKSKLSKLLSMPVMIGSICTAVLCVGWQLLRNR